MFFEKLCLYTANPNGDFAWEFDEIRFVSRELVRMYFPVWNHGQHFGISIDGVKSGYLAALANDNSRWIRTPKVVVTNNNRSRIQFVDNRLINVGTAIGGHTLSAAAIVNRAPDFTEAPREATEVVTRAPQTLSSRLSNDVIIPVRRSSGDGEAAPIIEMASGDATQNALAYASLGGASRDRDIRRTYFERGIETAQNNGNDELLEDIKRQMEEIEQITELSVHDRLATVERDLLAKAENARNILMTGRNLDSNTRQKIERFIQLVNRHLSSANDAKSGLTAQINPQQMELAEQLELINNRMSITLNEFTKYM